MESLSVVDIFKIGVGPSSSHTLGPWRAALRFTDSLGSTLPQVTTLQVKLYGSLAKTGKGHGSDIAVMMGLSGANPVTVDIEQIAPTVKLIRQHKTISLKDQHDVTFDPARDIIFLKDQILPFHPNGLEFIAQLSDGTQVSEVWFSVGGGFVMQENDTTSDTGSRMSLPYPIESATELSQWCRQTGLPISGVVAANEKAWRSSDDTRQAVMDIWQVMSECMFKGCHTSGILPGGLQVKRRASLFNERLLKSVSYQDYEGWRQAIRDSGNGFAYTLDWVSCFALAVNEQNAAFARVVTAPTNGAAGVIPAVLQYLLTFNEQFNDKAPDPELITRFLFTASEIGCIFKKRATISAAMGGCQAEIGVSSAMAAAGLTEALGGNPEQCLMAAEIAMEHHLGMTCDPVGGLVQVPCIERNAMGAVKAINAASLALKGDGTHFVPLDAAIETMRQTGADMHSKYKETSEGGLAVNLTAC